MGDDDYEIRDEDDDQDMHCNWDPEEYTQRKFAFFSGISGPHYPRSMMYKAFFMWQILLFMLQNPPEIPTIKAACSVILKVYLGRIAFALNIFATVMTPADTSLSVLGLKSDPCRYFSSTAARVPLVSFHLIWLLTSPYLLIYTMHALLSVHIP